MFYFELQSKIKFAGEALAQFIPDKLSLSFTKQST
jgi:hypothetical protein